tara:strand:- start:2200 stop:2832 length:633 start_codon:yes stop_codon:yes gene_type:complete
MIELELITTKDDGSKVYKPVEMTVKKVNVNNRGVYGFIFNERPNEQDNTEWWNASSFTVKANPQITQVKESDKIIVQLVHAPQINKEGVTSGGFWNNVHEMHIVEKGTEGDTSSPGEISTPHSTPNTTPKIDSFPKSLDYNVDRDNKIIMQVVLKAQVELVNSLLSANSDVSGILEGYEKILESNISKASDMIDEIWNKRTKISDWEIVE